MLIFNSSLTLKKQTPGELNRNLKDHRTLWEMQEDKLYKDALPEILMDITINITVLQPHGNMSQ